MIVRSTLLEKVLKSSTMKKLSFVLISLAILLSPLSKADTILVYGDSLSAGYGLQANEDWPSLLAKRLLDENHKQYTVVNASISGETTAGGLKRFAKTVKKHRPSIVILELGANDGLRGQPTLIMRYNLSKMIKHSLNNNAQVLLIAMEIPPNYGKRYSNDFKQSFKELQKEHDIALSDFLLSSLSGRPELIQKDGLHPTAKAQPLLLETVWKSLKPLLHTPK
jgi:acyl-CoA thioesterase-1